MRPKYETLARRALQRHRIYRWPVTLRECQRIAYRYMPQTADPFHVARVADSIFAQATRR